VSNEAGRLSREDLAAEIYENRQLINETCKIVVDKVGEYEEVTLTAIFSESRKIRREIGYQNIILKAIEDNVDALEIDTGAGVSSKVEVSLGGEVFGTGAKWVFDIDTGHVSYRRFLEFLLSAEKFTDNVKEKIRDKLSRKSDILGT